VEIEKNAQEIIDDVYDKIWQIIDDLQTLKDQALKIGEALKEIVSSDKFK